MNTQGTPKKCSEGCNAPEFLLVNGNEQEYICEPVLEDRLVDMVTNNDTITFHSGDKNKRTGIQVIEVL